MSSPTCSREPEILKSVTRGEAASVSDHLATCDACREAVIASNFMTVVASTPILEHSLPDPSAIWLKAQIMQSEQAEQKLSLKLGQMQIFSYLGVAVCWAIVLTWKWKMIAPVLKGFSVAHLLASPWIGEGATAISVMILFLALFTLTIVVTFHAALAEE